MDLHAADGSAAPRGGPSEGKGASLKGFRSRGLEQVISSHGFNTPKHTGRCAADCKTLREYRRHTFSGRKHPGRGVRLDLLSGKRLDSKMGALGAVFEASWAVLEASWALLGRFKYHYTTTVV